MPWTTRTSLDPSGVLTFQIADEQGSLLSRAYALALLRHEAEFREFLARALAATPFDAFYWEMPPTTPAFQGEDFEFVVIDAPPLARVRADPTDFAKRFAAAPSTAHVVAFPNLGGDAMLVVPTPRGPEASYAHLAAFVRAASPTQIDALFRTLAETVEPRLSAIPIWVSTAGLGASWLHLRIDTRPKYYRHLAYKRAPGPSRNPA